MADIGDGVAGLRREAAGLFDFLNIVNATVAGPHWLGLATEGYIFVGNVYWSFCFLLSRVSARIERDMVRGAGRGGKDMTTAAINVAGLSSWLGDFFALVNIVLAVPRGCSRVLCGPAGSGKSTLLRCARM